MPHYEEAIARQQESVSRILQNGDIVKGTYAKQPIARVLWSRPSLAELCKTMVEGTGRETRIPLPFPQT